MDSKKIVVKNTGKYGKGKHDLKGVFAVKKIKKGELVTEFDGDIYHWDEDERWTDYLYNHTIQFEEKRWRDSKGVAVFLNHSCEPNCGIKNLFQVVAMRDIEIGEEIFWDYEMTERHPYWRMKCKCGNKNCRKIIGNYDNMPEDVRKKYKGYISKWLLDKKPKKKIKK